MRSPPLPPGAVTVSWQRPPRSEVRVPVGNRVSVSQRVVRERHQPPLPLLTHLTPHSARSMIGWTAPCPSRQRPSPIFFLHLSQWRLCELRRAGSALAPDSARTAAFRSRRVAHDKPVDFRTGPADADAATPLRRAALGGRRAVRRRRRRPCSRRAAHALLRRRFENWAIRATRAFLVRTAPANAAKPLRRAPLSGRRAERRSELAPALAPARASARSRRQNKAIGPLLLALRSLARAPRAAGVRRGAARSLRVRGGTLCGAARACGGKCHDAIVNVIT